MPSCLKWGEKRKEECSETEDQGYNECAESLDEGYNECCDWWPCSWACDAWVWISNIVCVVWTWISNVVCVAWTVITTAICLMWDVISTVVGSVFGTIESILGWILSGITFFIEIIFSIPYIGAALRQLLGLLTHILWALVGFWDTVLGILGIRPEKRLRICTVILRDNRGNPVSSVEYVKSMLQVAADVYKRDANIRLIPSAPFKYNSGFDNAETVDDSWITIDDGTSGPDLLDDPDEDSSSSANDWTDIGAQFELITARCCFYGSWRRVIGYGAPITCFVIHSIPFATGRAGFPKDYIKIVGALKNPPADSPRTIGHEILHLVGFGHSCVADDPRNIMATADGCDPDNFMVKSDDANPRLSDYQAMVLRASKYATYF
jgi:hypothetical protein